MQSIPFRAALAGAVLLCGAPVAAAQSASPDSLRERYALPSYEVTDTTVVETAELTLKEIIDLCIEGEQTKLSGHDDLTYTANVRTILLWNDKKKEVYDQVAMGYEERSGFSRYVELDERISRYEWKDDAWVPDEDDDGDEEVRVNTRDENSSMFTDMPFFLEESGEFDFELADRVLLEDRVIFEIRFRPKSDFKPLPSGTVFVDTRDFRIIHEIFSFQGSQNPFPLVLEGIPRMSRQWKELPTGEWVVHQIAGEILLRDYFGLIPDRVTVAVRVEDFRFDEGYDARRFGTR